MRATIANRALFLASAPEGLRLRKALESPEEAQERALHSILRRNERTWFGRRHAFARISSRAEYSRRVPLSTWDELAPLVERAASGEASVLTREPILRLVPTSGTSGPAKRVPYTRGFEREVARAVAAWLADLFGGEPELVRGPAYWQVSPVSRGETRTPSGIPVGHPDDSAYAGRLAAWLLASAQAVPGSVARLGDVDGYRYAVLRHLLARGELRLVSVYSPSFLDLLLRPLLAWAEPLARDLRDGTLRATGERLRPDARRAAEVERALASRDAGERHRRLWPCLSLVSCWADGAAARDVGLVATLLPQARVQGKGLLATEGVTTIPLLGHPGAAPALRSHVVELLAGERAMAVEEAVNGPAYEVVLTTSAGLYRYRTGDLVEVVGRVGRTPLLRFLARSRTADRVGEKLTEAFVARALSRALDGLHVELAVLGLEEEPRPGYVLFVESQSSDDAGLLALGERLEAFLREGFGYAYARDLSQLAPLRVFRVEEAGREAWIRQNADPFRPGGPGDGGTARRLGDVKPAVLTVEAGWSRRFRGGFLSSTLP